MASFESPVKLDPSNPKKKRGEVMYCICVLGDIEFVSFYDCSIGEVMYCICV